MRTRLSLLTVIREITDVIQIGQEIPGSCIVGEDQQVNLTDIPQLDQGS
jgi:hypothetical protein